MAYSWIIIENHQKKIRSRFPGPVVISVHEAPLEHLRSVEILKKCGEVQAAILDLP